MKGPSNVGKKHHAVKSNLFINMMTFVKHFPLGVPITTFRFRPVPVFLEFYVPLFFL